MGSDFSKQICCVTCGRCKKEEVEEANEESSETKPILQPSGEASTGTDARPSTLALEFSKQVSEEVRSLRRVLRPSAAAAEESMETCSIGDAVGVTEGWVAAWDSLDFSVDPADGETQGKDEVFTQVDKQQEREKVGNTEEKIKTVPVVPEAQPFIHLAWDVLPAADPGQCEQAVAVGEGGLCSGVTPPERNIPNFMEFGSEKAAGQDPEIKPAGESLLGGNLLLCVVQMPEETETNLSVEGAERAQLGEMSPGPARGAELASLPETPALTVHATQRARQTEDALEAKANGMAKTSSACAIPWESLCPERETLELTNQLLDFLEQEMEPSVLTAREMESPRRAEPAEPSEASCQASGGVSGELGVKESRESDAGTAASEAEPQHGIMQQTEELPEEPLTRVQMPVNQSDAFLNVAPSLLEVFGSSGEAENTEA